MSEQKALDRALGWPGRLALGALLMVGLWLSLADVFTMLFFVSYAAVGAWLAVQRPRNFLGWLMVAMAFGFISPTTSSDPDVAALQAGTAPLADQLDVWVGAWSAYALFAGYVALTVLFPSGRLPERPWRAPAALLIAGGLVLALLAAAAPTVSVETGDGVMSATAPNPFAIIPEAPFWAFIPIDVLILPMVVLLVVAVGSMVVRYRRATGALKLQLRWLMAAIAFVVLAVIAGLSALAIIGDEIGGAAWIPAIVAYPCIPIAIGIAVLRYRLYEIDRLISRTIGWALVTGLLVGAFALLVVGSSELLEPLTGGNTLAVAGSTLVVALLFAPLRARVQRAVDRRFDRSRYDGERLISAFGERLRVEVDLDAIRADVLSTVDTAVRPTQVGLWLRVRDKEAPVPKPVTISGTPGREHAAMTFIESLRRTVRLGPRPRAGDEAERSAAVEALDASVPSDVARVGSGRHRHRRPPPGGPPERHGSDRGRAPEPPIRSTRAATPERHRGHRPPGHPG